jgi:hypothetical protein
MKISKMQIRLMIERALREADQTDPKIGKKDLDKTVVDIKSRIKQSVGDRAEADIHAITDFRKGSDRGGFPEIGFGDEEGINTQISDLVEPDFEDIAAVNKYRLEKYLGYNEKSAFDDEITHPEITQRDPSGTQLEKEDTEELKKWDDKTLTDPGDTHISGIPYPEQDYNDAYDEPAKTFYGEDVEKEKGTIEKLRDYFSKFLK